jgi:formyl-CoA transferase
LDGVIVADFSRVLAGPLATATLADLGADVIKVERSGTGDDTRAWGPPWTDDNSASYFEAANRGKRSLTLDLDDSADLRLAHELARRADVVVENFKTGALDRKGLGYEQVASSNPGVVYCSITGFGSGGGADLPGYDFLVQAVGGLMSISGEPDGAPTKVGVALVDVLTAKDATTAILAALRHRDATGVGQRVEVNLLSSLLGSLVNQASAYLTTGVPPARMGNAHPSIAPYELLMCADDYIAIACGNDNQFRRLVGVLERPELADDDRFTTNPQRVANRPALVKELESAFGTANAADWSERLAEVGVPAGRVGNIGDAFYLAARLGLAPTYEVGDERPAQVRNPATYSATPITRYQPPPRLGQHSDDLRRWLSEEI